MKRNTKILLAFITVSIFACSDPPPEVSRLRLENAKLRAELDSLKMLRDSIPFIDTAVVRQTLPEPAIAAKPGDIRSGRHAFTLQWISWDEPGSVNILPESEGWYIIKGSQKSRKNDDYITINGRIRKVAARELLFKGEIISRIAGNNGGKPCIKSGRYSFKSTLNRKYWRMQDMINCEGGMLTDYVDIYF